MSVKKIISVFILAVSMIIPVANGHTGSGQQIAPGQEKPNLDFLGVWICKSHRQATNTAPASSFRSNNYTINADGTVLSTANTNINTVSPGVFQNSGFFGRLPNQGEWERVSSNQIESTGNGQILSNRAGAAGKVYTDVTYTLYPGVDPQHDQLGTHTIFTYKRYIFNCNTVSEGTCTVKTAATECPSGCNLDGDIVGEEVVGTANSVADAMCDRVGNGYNSDFLDLPSPP